MDWPLVQRWFGLSRLAEISGVDASTVQRWQHRRAIPVRRVGRGTDRTYTLEDALHVAIIAEMSRMGLAITAKRAELSGVVLGYPDYRLRDDPCIDSLGSLALVPIPGEGDWLIEPRLERASEAGSYTVIGLAQIVKASSEQIMQLKTCHELCLISSYCPAKILARSKTETFHLMCIAAFWPRLFRRTAQIP